jgi:hypothetical protein
LDSNREGIDYMDTSPYPPIDRLRMTIPTHIIEILRNKIQKFQRRKYIPKGSLQELET